MFDGESASAHVTADGAVSMQNRGMPFDGRCRNLGGLAPRAREQDSAVQCGCFWGPARGRRVDKERWCFFLRALLLASRGMVND